MHRGRHVALIIPALDEQAAIGPVLDAVDREIVDVLIVVDNGSTDDTRAVAAAHGAAVLNEPRRGYGSACLRGIAHAADHGADLLVFLDGDGSDDPREIAALLDAMAAAEADMIIGSRVLGGAEPGALTPIQAFGNWLTCELVAAFWGVRFSDLGPFRAITAAALARLEMADPDFGWTIEMQVKAAQRGLRVVEMPVTRRVRQAGHSKVSGTLRGSYMAGRRILGYVIGAWLHDQRPNP